MIDLRPEPSWPSRSPSAPAAARPAARGGRRTSLRLPSKPESRSRPAPAATPPPSERARLATGIDRELRLACRDDATLRRELGCAARDLLRGRGYRRLGFVRLGDYAVERLGISARTLQAAAWLATRLDDLPAVSRAFDRSEISWSQARAICAVARPGDQERWLVLAGRCTVETLAGLARRTGAPDRVPGDPEGEAAELDGEPIERWRLACPARVRGLWRRATEMASRMAGAPLSAWRAAEAIAAEGFSGCRTGATIGGRARVVLSQLARRLPRARIDDGDGVPTPIAPVEAVAGPTAPPGPNAALDVPRQPAVSSVTIVTDPFALDARLVEAMRELRTIEPRIGRLLRAAVDHRIHRFFGYGTLDRYVRERLGISIRKAWALLQLERAVLRSDAFARAYREGRLSWSRALALLPVLDHTNATAWIARAEMVTHQRLCRDVTAVLQRLDEQGGTSSPWPPSLDEQPAPDGTGECRDLSPAAAVQIGARSALPDALARRAPAEVRDAEIAFTGPASVVALLRDVLDAFAVPETPRWVAVEHLLRHVLAEWEAAPRHRDPVFARDGWSCTVPACSSRRNLHDHHIHFRSRGGDNRRDNRTVVCAAHHLHGIHAGTIVASGTAPDAIEWQLGVRPGAPPLLRYIGDRVK